MTTRTLASLGLALLVGGCGSKDPAWAIDPMWIEPTDDGIRGFQTWQLYGSRWERKQKDSTFVCTIVVELDGTETPCTDCQIAWEVTPAVLDSDCDPAVAAQPTWTWLERISVGLPLTDGARYPGQTVQGFADYGWGWEVHGQAWPDAVASGTGAGLDGTWDGIEPFAFWPELAWPVPGQ